MNNQNFVFEKLTQTLAAGQQVVMNMAGNFLRIVAASASLDVALLKAGRVIGTMSGMAIGDRINDIDFDGFVITNGATPQDVTLQIASGGAGSDAVFGTVAVSNFDSVVSERSLALGGKSFMASIHSNTGAAGPASAQLLNPAGSGKILVVTKASIWASAIPTTPVGLYEATAILPGAYATGGNKVLGTPNGVAVKKIGNATFPTLGDTLFSSYITGAGQAREVLASGPIVIPPGESIIAATSVITGALTLHAEWTEE